MSDKSELRKRNLRTALILATIAMMFVLGLVAKRTWFM